MGFLERRAFKNTQQNLAGVMLPGERVVDFDRGELMGTSRPVNLVATNQRLIMTPDGGDTFDYRLSDLRCTGSGRVLTIHNTTNKDEVQIDFRRAMKSYRPGFLEAIGCQSR